MNKLLSIDWDFFFPIPSPEDDHEFLYDWGHSENYSFMLNGIWDIRASSFIRSGMELPTTSGEEDMFWERFNFCDDTTLYYADSHAKIYNPEILKGIDTVWNFDAHHDAYLTIKHVKGLGNVTCDNWVIALVMRGIKVKNFFPKWKKWDMEGVISVPHQNDNGKKFHKPFRDIFICRSGAWTPTWIEDKFWNFIDTCPINNKINIDGITTRVFSKDDVIEQVNLLDTILTKQNKPIT